MFDNHSYNIHERQAGEVIDSDSDCSDNEKEPEMTKEEAAAKFPFF